MKPSKPFSLNSLDYQKVLKDTLFFALVPLTFWIVAVLTKIQEPNHVISIMDFIPTNATIIAMVSWILNQILNLIRKYIA